jgi:hypothetical protein
MGLPRRGHGTTYAAGCFDIVLGVREMRSANVPNSFSLVGWGMPGSERVLNAFSRL